MRELCIVIHLGFQLTKTVGQHLQCVRILCLIEPRMLLFLSSVGWVVYSGKVVSFLLLFFCSWISYAKFCLCFSQIVGLPPCTSVSSSATSEISSINFTDYIASCFFERDFAMASTRKATMVNKRFSKLNEECPDKDGSNTNKNRTKKRKLSDMLGSQWSKEELERFYTAYRKHGKDWKKVAGIIRNRTTHMVEALYNMNRAYLSLPEGTATAAGLIAMMTDHYNILEAYDRYLSDKYGEDTSPPQLDPETWVAAVGQPRKGRMYRFDSSLDTTAMMTSSASSCSPSTNRFTTPPSVDSHIRELVREELMQNEQRIAQAAAASEQRIAHAVATILTQSGFFAPGGSFGAPPAPPAPQAPQRPIDGEDDGEGHDDAEDDIC